jgi:choline dehydrogenase-like flavoprotein
MEVEYDAIVVGSGATGGWAAKELCERGFSVLVLEAGPTLRPIDRQPRTEPSASAWQATRKIQAHHPACNRDSYHLFVDDVANPYTTPDGAPFDWIRSRQVGGRSVLWGGVMLRMSDLDFKCAAHDGFGMDWPIAYRDLEPFYDQVERFVGVSGTAEGIPSLPDGAYVTAGVMTEGEKHLKRVVETRWPERHVTSGRAIVHRHGADPDWETKTSTGSTLAAARATGRMELRSNAIVRTILVDNATATGVAFVDAETREDHEVRAKAIVLCASTIESVRLLFNSGIGNGSGQLGRYVMDHTRVGILGVCPQLANELGPKFGGPNSIYMPRFRNVTDREPGFIRGYQLFGAVQRQGMPAVGPDGAATFAFSIQGEQLPVETNRVTIDPSVRDAWGIPVPHIACYHGENEKRMAVDALARAREMIAEAAFQIVTEYTSLANPGWLIHEVGGARMGTDPRTSVVDPFNRVWDCPNVVVTDGACWVSGGCQNPTLTMMALTARACRELEP